MNAPYNPNKSILSIKAKAMIPVIETSTKANISSIKEFNKTLEDAHSLTPKMISIIPNWFSTSKGPIIGWYISHEGFQSGALSRARNYGIVTSDSKDLAEVIACSKRLKPYLSEYERVKSLSEMISSILLRKHINMDLW